MDEQPDAYTAYLISDTKWMEEFQGGYVVTIELEPADQIHPFEYLLVGLTGAQDQYDMATFRMLRAGGTNAADAALRRNLFTLVGAITIAGGHIEAEMKRIVIQAEEDSGATFVEVDETWTGLEKRLEAIVADDGPLAFQINEALAWAKKSKVKAIRDDAVHSTWCLYDVGSVHRSRFRRKAEGEMHVARLEEFMSHVATMYEYVGRLARIGSWPTAVLPPVHAEPQAIIELNVSTGASRGDGAAGG